MRDTPLVLPLIYGSVHFEQTFEAVVAIWALVESVCSFVVRVLLVDEYLIVIVFILLGLI